jgi:hypothetical protein
MASFLDAMEDVTAFIAELESKDCSGGWWMVQIGDDL